jgi:hypothetical protein
MYYRSRPGGFVRPPRGMCDPRDDERTGNAAPGMYRRWGSVCYGLCGGHFSTGRSEKLSDKPRCPCPLLACQSHSSRRRLFVPLSPRCRRGAERQTTPGVHGTPIPLPGYEACPRGAGRCGDGGGSVEWVHWLGQIATGSGDIYDGSPASKSSSSSQGVRDWSRRGRPWTCGRQEWCRPGPDADRAGTSD